MNAPFKMTLEQSKQIVEIYNQFVATRDKKILHRNQTTIASLYVAYGNTYNCNCKLARAIAFLYKEANTIIDAFASTIKTEAPTPKTPVEAFIETYSAFVEDEDDGRTSDTILIDTPIPSRKKKGAVTDLGEV